MKVRNSLKSLRGRHRNNRIIRRKGRVYVINKTQRRFKARQGLVLSRRFDGAELAWWYSHS